MGLEGGDVVGHSLPANLKARLRAGRQGPGQEGRQLPGAPPAGGQQAVPEAGDRRGVGKTLGVADVEETLVALHKEFKKP
jgi:hypothetical protein